MPDGKKVKAAAAACLLSMALSGCSGVFDREYRYEETYEEEYSSLREDSSIQEVRNYVGMKSALLNLINSGTEHGIIRTEKYSGSVEDDISKACFEVTRESPMGIYAVDYMTHSITRIVSYYEIEINISYKRTVEEISGVKTVRSALELQSLIDAMMKSYRSSMAVMQVSTDISDDEIAAMVDRCYRSSPQDIPERPSLRINTYASPSNNIQRITEIEESFTMTREELSQRTAVLRNFAYSLFDSSTYGNINYICSSVAAAAYPAEKGYTAYDALMAGQGANSEGYAMAVKLLCALSGIECYVVEGRLNGEEHFWNIVNVNGRYCHADVFEADMAGANVRFRSDGDMLGRYWWDTSVYPECAAAPARESEAPDANEESVTAAESECKDAAPEEGQSMEEKKAEQTELKEMTEPEEISSAE